MIIVIVDRLLIIFTVNFFVILGHEHVKTEKLWVQFPSSKVIIIV